MYRATYKPGEAVFRQGDKSGFAYSVVSGTVRIEQTRDGAVAVLAQLGPGEVFGEMGLVEERPRSASAIAESEVQLNAITEEEFFDLLFNKPEEGLRYLLALFERLRTMNARLALQAAEPAPIAMPALSACLIAQGEAAVAALGTAQVELQTPRVLIGRGQRDGSSKNDITLQDKDPYQVSRSHVALERTPAGWAIVDRGSFLGTLVNGQRIGGKREEAAVMLGRGDHESIFGQRRSGYRFVLRIG
jgi:CRP-like cAMP-binding protein